MGSLPFPDGRPKLLEVSLRADACLKRTAAMTGLTEEMTFRDASADGKVLKFSGTNPPFLLPISAEFPFPIW